MTTWTIRFDDNGEGLSTGEIAELEGLVTTLGFSATISSAPPVLSREFLDSLIEELSARRELPAVIAEVYNDGMNALADAILESLSQEDNDG